MGLRFFCSGYLFGLEAIVYWILFPLREIHLLELAEGWQGYLDLI